MNVEITSTLEWFSTHLTIIARMYKLFTRDLGEDLGEDLRGIWEGIFEGILEGI